jgi:sugar-specific transcriptional regulator TrmB
MKEIEQDEDVKMLVDLGLTHLQAETYLAVAELGEAPIKVIAKASNVARQNIYQTMLSLQELGLVEKILEVPIKYRAIPVKQAADMLFNNKTQEYLRLEAETEELEKRPGQNHIYPEDNHEFILIPEKEGHWRRVEQGVQSARKSVHTIMTYSDEAKTPEVKDLPKPFQDAIARGVNVKVISNQPMNAAIQRETSKGKMKGSYEVRFSPTSIPVMFCAIDGKEVFLAIEPRRDPTTTGALWTTNPGLVTIVEDYFHRMWRRSKIVLS